MDNVVFLGIVSFINDLASKMILPVLPLYIKELGGAGLAIGLISGFGESIASFLKVLSGYWSDKIGRRRPFIFWGYFVSAVAKLLFYTARSWPLILLFRGLERSGKGLRSASRDAMIAASADKDKKGKAFGIHRAFDSGGAVLGSVVVLCLIIFLNLELKYIFLIAGIISFFALIPIFLTKETGSKERASKMKLVVSFRQFPPALKKFIFIAVLFSVGNFSWMFFVLKAQGSFTGHNEIIIPIILYIIYNFSYTLLAAPSGILADRFGKDKVLIIGYALFGLVAMSFIFAASIGYFITLFFIYGIVYAFVESNERAYVSDLADQKIRGTALGTLFTLTSILALPSGILVGVLYDLNPGYAFLFGSVISFSTVALFLFSTLGKSARHV